MLPKGVAQLANLSTFPVLPDEPADRWRTRRIWIAGALGAMLPASQWILDFWPLGGNGSLEGAARAFFDFSRLLVLLPLAGFVVVLLIAAGIALWRRHVRRMASSILAIAAIPFCLLLVDKLPLFDPWLWYAMVNSGRFKALAESLSPADEPKYAVIEERDVSVGLAGLNPNHFVMLVYDESDNVGLDPSDRPRDWRSRTIGPAPIPIPPIPKGRRLYGHFFRVDDFE
jgi:hypothetical protein